MIALIWGQAHCESEPTLNAEGQLTAQANSLARQFAEDMSLLGSVGAAEEFVELWASSGSSWRALFDSDEIRQSFLVVDVSELKSRYLAQSPQAGASDDGSEVSVEELRGDWVCGLPNAIRRQPALSTGGVRRQGGGGAVAGREFMGRCSPINVLSAPRCWRRAGRRRTI